MSKVRHWSWNGHRIESLGDACLLMNEPAVAARWSDERRDRFDRIARREGEDQAMGFFFDIMDGGEGTSDGP